MLRWSNFRETVAVPYHCFEIILLLGLRITSPTVDASILGGHGSWSCCFVGGHKLFVHCTIRCRMSRNPPHSRLDRIWNTSCTSPCRDLLTSILTKTQGQTFFFIASPVEQTTGGVPQNYLGVSKIDTDRLIPPFRLQVFLYSVSNTHDHLQQMPPEGLLKNMMLCPPPFR